MKCVSKNYKVFFHDTNNIIYLEKTFYPMYFFIKHAFHIFPSGLLCLIHNLSAALEIAVFKTLNPPQFVGVHLLTLTKPLPKTLLIQDRFLQIYSLFCSLSDYAVEFLYAGLIIFSLLTVCLNFPT